MNEMILLTFCHVCSRDFVLLMVVVTLPETQGKVLEVQSAFNLP